jgi:hypothetical protein
MSKTYGWYSRQQEAERGGTVYYYTGPDGTGEVVVTEATSRADYKSALDDAVSLGEVGRFLRSEKRDPPPAEAKSPPPAEAKSPPPLNQSAIAAMSRISKQVEVLTEEQKAEVAAALHDEAVEDAAATKAAGAAAAAMGELDLTPVSVGDPAGVSVVAPVADDSTDLDDLIGSLQDDA